VIGMALGELMNESVDLYLIDYKPVASQAACVMVM
jgi:hypothetical protein